MKYRRSGSSSAPTRVACGARPCCRFCRYSGILSIAVVFLMLCSLYNLCVYIYIYMCIYIYILYIIYKIYICYIIYKYIYISIYKYIHMCYIYIHLFSQIKKYVYRKYNIQQTTAMNEVPP